MGPRRVAVAATLTSLALFGALLASNYAVYGAEEHRMILYALSDRLSAISTAAEFGKGVSAFSFLLRSQVFLESNSLSCSNPQLTLASLEQVMESRSNDGFSARLGSSVVWSGTQEDNLTLLIPFNGYVPGNLNFLLSLSLDLSGPSVQYHKLERHYVHLPVLYDSSLSACLSAIGYLNSKIQEMKRTPGVCYTTAIESIIDEASRLYGAASRGGLTLSITRSIDHTTTCPVIDYEVTVSQYGVKGVSGEFTWQVSEGGSVRP